MIHLKHAQSFCRSLTWEKVNKGIKNRQKKKADQLSTVNKSLSNQEKTTTYTSYYKDKQDSEIKIETTRTQMQKEVGANNRANNAEKKTEHKEKDRGPEGQDDERAEK